MKILMAHNFYMTAGGEDESYKAEKNLLINNGHEVISYEKFNSSISINGKVSASIESFWSRQTYKEVKKLILENRVDIVHCQNIFPLISPSIYYAAGSLGIPVVQALRNYRRVCLNASLYRHDSICHRCLDSRTFLPGIKLKCYKESITGSAVMALSNNIHDLIGTYRSKVDAYIAVSEYVKDIHVRYGIRKEKIYVKPNTTDNLKLDITADEAYFCYVGRFTVEKGFFDLIETWKNRPDWPKLILVGAVSDELQKVYSGVRNIRFAGELKNSQVKQVMAGSIAVVIPSKWEEPFGRVAIEAFSQGTAVIACKIGGLTDIIEHGKTGLFYSPSNIHEMSKMIDEMAKRTDLAKIYGEAARLVYEDRYSNSINYGIIMDVYSSLRSGENVNDSE